MYERIGVKRSHFLQEKVRVDFCLFVFLISMFCKIRLKMKTYKKQRNGLRMKNKT